jgi:lipoprotein-anchoring transpeptidase ErfK/SrfK
MWIAEVLTEELTRQERFTELNGSELNQASLTVVPLFRWSKDRDGINGALLGFWLRSRTATNTYGAQQERLASCRMVGITDEEEVSGRGVPEIVASLALFGIASSAFLAQDASAGTDSLGSPDTITSVAPRVPSKQRLSVRPPSAERRFQQEPIKTYEDVLGRANAENTHVVVSISRQRAYLMVGDEIAVDSPISSGRAHRTTGTGTFTVTEKDKNHISSKYHCPMKYFLRLSDSAIGLHVGQLPGYPASHGCVRLPENAAKLFFENATVGTSVSIEA